MTLSRPAAPPTRAASRAAAPMGALGRYLHHPQPRVAAANLLALVVGWNTPLYPLMLRWAAGPEVWPTGWLTLLSCPLFLAVPWLARRNPMAGLALLASAGTLNTLFCAWVLGPGTGIALFLPPCALLAALLHRPQERSLMLGLLGLILAVAVLCAWMPVPPLLTMPTEAAARVLAMNAGSVLCLSLVMALRYARLLEGEGR